jgi:dephospho-CoA kinase
MSLHIPTLVDFYDTARWAGADESLVLRAARCTSPRLVVSGRLASGKDTVAEAAMSALGCSDAVRVSFATALRREVDEIIDALRSTPAAHAAAVTAQVSGVTVEAATPVAELLVQALAQDPAIHSYVRTREIRLALQHWGTNVRRASDDEYWVKQAMLDVVKHLAEGHSVYVTDARFINEVTAARSLGFVAVRLEVDLPIRAARLYARDGLEIDPASENHPSEMELENYQGFDLWVDNSGPLDESVHQVVSHIRTLQG